MVHLPEVEEEVSCSSLMEPLDDHRVGHRTHSEQPEPALERRVFLE